jgi:hypothetical protein
MDPSVAPAKIAIAITPTDGVRVACRAIYVGTTGNLAVVMAQGETAVIFKNVGSGSTLPISAYYINATGTTASDIVALF